MEDWEGGARWREGVHSWSRSWVGVKGQQLDVHIGTTAGCAYRDVHTRVVQALDVHTGAWHSWMRIEVQGTAGWACKGNSWMGM